MPATEGVFRRILSTIASHDYVTVDVFFVLSGFLITSLLLEHKEKPHYFYNFYWRRALRIVPVLLITMALFWHSVPWGRSYILLCFLFVANFSGHFGVPILSPLWTLCVEEQFYLIWPHAVRHCKLAILAWMGVGLMVFSTLLRVLIPYVFHWPLDLTYSFYRLDGLGFGVLAACAYMTEEKLTPALRRVMKVLESDTLLYIWVAAFLMLPVFPHIPYLSQIYLSISLSNYLLFRFIYAVVVRKRRFPGLASAPMLYMGSISYAFYMFHTFVIGHFLTHYGPPDLMHGWVFVGRMLLVYALTIAAASASLFLVEKPAQRLRRYILARPSDIHESMAIQPPQEEALVSR